MASVASPQSTMILYSNDRCPYCHRVRLVMAEKGVAAEIREPGEALPQLNPYGTVPVLVDSDLTLFESHIIMEYLDESVRQTPLMPADPIARARLKLQLYRVDRDWFSHLPQIAGGGDAAPEARAALTQSLAASAALFAATPFLLSDELTLLDCAVAPLLWRLPRLGIELPPEAEPILAYAERLFKRSAFVASLSETERGMRG